MPVIALIGLFRSGTNYARTLLETNFDVEVRFNSLGWKHGPVPTYAPDSCLSYAEAPILVITRHPLSSFLSWYNYLCEKGRNLNSDSDLSSLAEFVNAPITYFDEFARDSPEYMYSSPVEMWNSVTWNHISFAVKRAGVVTQYEELVSNPEVSCTLIANQLGLSRKTTTFLQPDTQVANLSDFVARDKINDYLRNSSSTSKYLFTNKRSLIDSYSTSQLAEITSMLNPRVMRAAKYTIDQLEKKVQHAVISPSSSAEESHEKLTLFTVASDSRIADLAVFLESVSRCPSFSLKVIPFDENDMHLTKQLCDVYSIEVENSIQDWDALGQFFFSDRDHKERGKGVKAWRYFRKLNAISLSQGRDFIFMDANSILLSNSLDTNSINKKVDVVFGHRSAPQRNFSPWSKFVLNQFSPSTGNGYGAGFWYVKAGSLKENIFSDMARFPGIRSMIAIAPEQSVLNIAVVLSQLKVALLESVSNLDYCMIGANSVDIKCSEAGRYLITKKSGNKQLFAAKWTGNYHANPSIFNNAEIHSHFSQAALSKASKHQMLSEVLREKYQKLYGFSL